MTKKSKQGMHAGPAVMAKIRDKQVSADVMSLPLVAMTDFPDEAFEGFQSPRVDHPMAAGTPSCAVCEGSLRGGQILVVIDKGRISHLSCFEGAKVHETKGESEQTEADAVLVGGSVVTFTRDTTQNCRHSRWKGRSSEPEARSVIPAGRYLVNGGVDDDVRLTVVLGGGNPSAKHSYLVPKDAPWGCWMDEGVVVRE